MWRGPMFGPMFVGDPTWGIALIDNGTKLSFKFDQRVIRAWSRARNVFKIDLDKLVQMVKRQTMTLYVLAEGMRVVRKQIRWQVSYDTMESVLDPGKRQRMARRGTKPLRRSDNFSVRFVNSAVAELSDLKPWGDKRLHVKKIRNSGKGGLVVGYELELASQAEIVARLSARPPAREKLDVFDPGFNGNVS
jgi:hypothetical protein